MIILLINFRRFDDQKALVRLPHGIVLTLTFLRIALLKVEAHAEWNVKINS